jgi:hypothetical protein
MSGRPKGELVLSDSEREELQALTMRRKTAQALALRARIVLALCRWHRQQDSGQTAGHLANGFEVAGAVRDPSSGWIARCTSARHAEDD